MVLVRKGGQTQKCCSCLAVNTENERDEWDQFQSAFYEKFFNSVCLSANYLMKTVLFVASCIYRCHVDVWSVYYVIFYVHVYGAKVNYTSSKNEG